MAKPAKPKSSRLITLDTAIAEYIASTKSSFSHDRSKTVGASEIGKCARQVAAEKQLGKDGYDEGFAEAFEDGAGYATRGNVMEDSFIAPAYRSWIEKMGASLHHATQADQLSIVAEEHHASATPDGIVTGMPPKAFVPFGLPEVSAHVLPEFKSIDPMVNVSRLPRTYHADQVNYGIGLVRAATEYRPDYGHLVYVNASNYRKWTSFVLPYSKTKFKMQLARAESIMTKPWDTIAPEGKIRGGKECETCAFAGKCLGFAAWVPKAERELKKREADEVVQKAVAIELARRAAVEAQQGVRDAEAELKVTLTKLKTKSARLGKVNIHWSKTDGAERFDQKKMLAQLTKDGHDPKKFKSKGKTGDRLNVEIN